ncbi:hypothetical protein SHLO109777_04720 [Shewanella loihica]|uniref:hypothetical protein n=1 Tax=Shewanella loihica TaxID=359303 RepID=UPI00059C1437|nr:hypothetical protein [Shewanella loihica]
MKRHASLSAWLFVIMIVVGIVGVFFTGFLALKIYRKYRPFPEPSEEYSLLAYKNIQADGFFKTFFVGVLISSPVLYYLITEL